jgi:hypothetical protein
MMLNKKQTRLKVIDRQKQRLERKLTHLEALDRRFSWIRLAVLLVGGLASFISFFFGPPALGPLILGLFVAAFAFVVYLHRKLDRSLLRFRIALQLTANQAARMRLDWTLIPVSPAYLPGTNHPFANDLNLVGERSIHQLLDTATSLGGSQRLGDWLLKSDPDPQLVKARQIAIQELIPLVGFRQHLAINGALTSKDPSKRWQDEKLLKWLTMQVPGKTILPTLWFLSILAAINIILGVLYALQILPAFWVIPFMVYLVVYMARYRDMGELFDESYEMQKTLDPLKNVLLYLESYPYIHHPQLSRICAPFWRSDRRPSRYLRRIALIASATSLKNNLFIWAPINALLPWDFFFGHLLNQSRRQLQDLLPSWLNSWYELEALNSLANFAYLNPGYIFPIVFSNDDPSEKPVFEARRLGHPLIEDDIKVTNDFSVDALGGVTIISGSNMSGKSTFLRTLGVNLCLAYVGGPVNADGMRIIPMRLFTCIQISDSLSNGISYFYAEVQRLKMLLEALQKEDAFPLFFLIDEIFRGTNNKERRIGSRAYVQSLIQGRGVGVISTHDLELVKLADEVSGIRNFHFREDVQAERMVFDYRLRPGPCPTTNALKIMQLEGLPVSPVGDDLRNT